MCFQKLNNIAKQNSFLSENVPIYSSINDLEVVNLIGKEEMEVLVEIESEDHGTILTTSLEQEEIFEEEILNQEEVFEEEIWEDIFD